MGLVWGCGMGLAWSCGMGLAWDCGAATTGPVTVPLVLALGIGVCRIVDDGDAADRGRWRHGLGRHTRLLLRDPRRLEPHRRVPQPIRPHARHELDRAPPAEHTQVAEPEPRAERG